MKKGYIYKITSPSGKIYIGKTFYISSRKANYKKYRCKGQRILYNSLLKYGWDNHLFEIVKEGIFTDEELSKLESHYIIHYNTFKSWNPNIGMNLTLGGDGCRIVHHTDETKKKISNSRKNQSLTDKQKNYFLSKIGKKINKSKEWIDNNAASIKKPIIQLTLFNQFVKEWKSAKDVQDELGFCRKNIGANLKKRTKTAYGYKWIFKTKS
jgi:group I intron endonuclease